MILSENFFFLLTKTPAVGVRGLWHSSPIRAYAHAEQCWKTLKCNCLILLRGVYAKFQFVDEV